MFNSLNKTDVLLAPDVKELHAFISNGKKVTVKQNDTTTKKICSNFKVLLLNKFESPKIYFLHMLFLFFDHLFRSKRGKQPLQNVN